MNDLPLARRPEARIYQVPTDLVAALADPVTAAHIRAGLDWYGQGSVITAKLRADIAARGMLDPIEIGVTRAGKIYLSNGNHRVLIALDLRLPTVPVVIVTDYLARATFFSPAQIGLE